MNLEFFSQNPELLWIFTVFYDLTLAIILFSIDNKSNESLNLAKNALKANPKYVSSDYQEKQLWGKKLQKSAQILFKAKEMKKVVKEAKEKSQ